MTNERIKTGEHLLKFSKSIQNSASKDRRICSPSELGLLYPDLYSFTLSFLISQLVRAG